MNSGTTFPGKQTHGVLDAIPNWRNTILWGGLVAGILDATDGVIAYGLLGKTRIQVLQYIASGLLGSSAFSGGLATAGVGVVIHFLIAFSVAGLYFLAAKRIPFLVLNPTFSGLAFGAAVYLIMTFVVLPFSAIPKESFSLALFLNGIVGHALFVGLPISLLARQSGQLGRRTLIPNHTN